MELVVRATVIYWFLWLIVRGTGKRSLAELTPLDLLLVVVMGDFVQQGVTQEDMSIGGALIAVAVFVFWTLAADALGRRSRSAERILTSTPVMVVHDGRLLEDKLSQERISTSELEEAARVHGFADLADVEYCFLEADGKFSFLRRDSR